MKQKHINILQLAALIVLTLTSSCRGLEPTNKSTAEITGTEEDNGICGFFLLNQGNMGTNKCTLDYYDYSSGIYYKNIFPERNKDVVLGLGDSGNDIKVYGNKLYAVINGSNLVEVMDLATARHITQISIPNCRYLTFHKGYAYVTSYAGNNEPDIASTLGSVFKIDTTTLNIVGKCTVGYQPEEMVVSSDKLYVANSGGYRYDSGDYDTRVSVIDLNTFTEIKKIEVAPNLEKMEIDRLQQIWVSSRGNYFDIPSTTSVIDPSTDQVKATLPLPNTNMTVCGDSLYVYASEWSYDAMAYEVSYKIVDINTLNIVSNRMITDGTEPAIASPYAIAVNPQTRDILISDAVDYVTPGKVFCYSKDGKKKWEATTGDIPACIAFTYTKLE